ncbi:sugar ABC transporter permease [Candidatus Aerophobetes bacterium]|nr:sugar ABC transporter permease [Candidatus Aerophobetes bacterium]
MSNFTLRKKKRRLGVEYVGYVFLLPFIIYLAVWKIFPMAYLSVLSFFKWDLISSPEFVGLKNYIRLAHSEKYWAAFYHTFLYIGGVLVISISAALLLAALFKGLDVKGRTIFLTAIFIPYIISESAGGYMWMWMLEEGGLINYYLTKLGFPPIHWLSTPKWAMFSIIMMSSWRLTGYNAVIFFIGLQSIPEIYYEAAKIDGATGFKSFWHITLPLVRPMMLYVLVMSMIVVSQAFTPIYVLTGGGPYGSTDVLLLRTYNMAFENYQMGYASAISMTLCVILMIIMYIQFKYLKPAEG